MCLSPIFEAAFHKRGASNPGFLELLDSLEAGIQYNPRSVGEPHPGYECGNYWVHESPPAIRLPRAFILYEIRDEAGKAVLWNFCLK